MNAESSTAAWLGTKTASGAPASSTRANVVGHAARSDSASTAGSATTSGAQYTAASVKTEEPRNVVKMVVDHRYDSCPKDQTFLHRIDGTRFGQCRAAIDQQHPAASLHPTPTVTSRKGSRQWRTPSASRSDS
jgi:hypothetical protein